jgi:hypothetical protein
VLFQKRAIELQPCTICVFFVIFGVIDGWNVVRCRRLERASSTSHVH